jgi:hypothetical protein
MLLGSSSVALTRTEFPSGSAQATSRNRFTSHETRRIVCRGRHLAKLVAERTPKSGVAQPQSTSPYKLSDRVPSGEFSVLRQEAG